MDDSPISIAVLYRARNLIEAQSIQFALEDAGLTARVEGEYLGTVMGEIPLGIATLPRVVVKADELERANEILKEFLSQHQAEES